MNNAVVVGVGNIYANEALFRSGIKPQTIAGRLGMTRLTRLHQAIKEVLAEAIAAGGSTIRDFRQAGGSTGYFQMRFAVYGRAGESCRVCGTTIQHQQQHGRASFWCPKCQRR